MKKNILFSLIAFLLVASVTSLAMATTGSLSVTVDKAVIKGIELTPGDTANIAAFAGEIVPIQVQFTSNTDITDAKIKMWIRKTIRVGNSAGVLLPRRLLGAEVKIIILKRAMNHKRIALRLLLPYLEEIESACITNTSPLEIIAISSSLKKILKNSQIKITFVPKNLFLKDFEKNISLRKKILVSIPLINKNFFKELI